MRELIRRFRAWQNRRYWQAHQMEHLRLMLQEDGRWMAHNPIAAALTDRYLAATAEDWYQQVFVHSGHLREQLGLDPHAEREHARVQTASASCAGHAGPLSVVGLGERDALSAADVDQPVAVAAAQAEEKASPLIDFGRDGSEHHLQPAGSALPHGESPATGAEESSTGELRTNDAAQPARAGGDAPILVTVGAMHQCRSTDKIDICAHCGAMAEELSKPCKAWLKRADAALAVAPQPAPTEPPLSLTLPIQAREIIDKLLELAAIVDRAVEDWGESLPDDSCIVTFHKDEAEKRDGVLEWLDALPDPDDESYVYSGPAKAAHILKTLIGKEGGVA